MYKKDKKKRRKGAQGLFIRVTGANERLSDEYLLAFSRSGVTFWVLTFVDVSSALG